MTMKGIEMHDRDKDIEELEQLLGPAVADYRAMRHSGKLSTHRTSPRRLVPVRSIGIAASVLLVVTAVALLAPEAGRHGNNGALSEMPISLPGQPGMRPTGIDRPRLSTALVRPSVGMSLPRRPSQSNG